MFISVSLTSASFDRLGEYVEAIHKSDADAVHFDITDGALAPSLILSPKSIKDLRKYSDKPFDVDITMLNPSWIIDQVAEAGANACAFKWDYANYPRNTLMHINQLGMRGGLSIRPKCEVPDMSYARELFDYIIIQTVEPAPYYGFLPYMAEKLKAAKALERNKGISWWMDGDVNPDNLERVIRSGVDGLVIGSWITSAPNIVDRVREIKDRIAEIQAKMV